VAADAVGRAGTALREFARGIYPTALAQGLGPALQGLGESTGIALTGLPTRRLPPLIEATADQMAVWAATTGAASLRVDTMIPTTMMTIRFSVATRTTNPVPSALTDRVHAVAGPSPRKRMRTRPVPPSQCVSPHHRPGPEWVKGSLSSRSCIGSCFECPCLWRLDSNQ